MNPEVKEARDAINLFVANRKKAQDISKLDKRIADKKFERNWPELVAKREQLIDEFGNQMREPWIEKNSKNAKHVSRVTHADKYIHPDISGTDRILFSEECSSDRAGYVGTHSIPRPALEFDFLCGGQFAGLSAFLRVRIGGRYVYECVRTPDPVFLAAVSDDNDKARAWLEDLSGVADGLVNRSTHTRAKQLYFPVGEGGYHLVAPLFPTSLVQALYAGLQAAQFSDGAKEARKAKKEGKHSDHGYCDYPNLAVQVFGGSKPLNISQLNSERHGEAWLLASVPPVWHSPAVRPPLGVATVFGRWFGRRREVGELTRALADFLTSTDYNNINIRNKRQVMVEHIVDELVQFAAELHEIEPGWSTSSECLLNPSEALWLDPGRAASDEVFAQALAQGDWREQIAHRFAQWLNGQLRYHSKKKGELPLGDVEHAAWKSVTESVLNMLDTEVGHG